MELGLKHMVGMKEICAMLLAGGIGATSVVTVQKARAPTTKAKPKPTNPKPQRIVSNAMPAPVRAATPVDCTVPVVALSAGTTDLMALPFDNLVPMDTLGGGAGAGGGDGGGSFGPSIRPGPTPVPPGIPQPDSWIMMVAGFGFIGLALRRSASARRKITA
ncbi:MAG: PEP-CTERM sorting domain-containing protein [Sandaracinobacteroides sp.]